MTDKMMILTTTTTRTGNVIPVIVTPSAVPADGGCSVSVTTMMKIDVPTARE